MIKSESKISKRDYLTRKKSLLKIKIVGMLKAYTLRNFSVDDSINTVTCNVSIRRDGITKELSKAFTIIYRVQDIPNDDLHCTLQLYASTS